MRILLLGASGCLGTGFSVIAQEAGHELQSPSHAELDLTDGQSLCQRIADGGFDAVCNFAAIVDMNRCEREPQRAFEVHASGCLSLAKACAEKDVLLVHASTHAVFDGLKQSPYVESDVPNPRNVYAASKYAGECFVRNLAPKHLVIRFPSLYGARRNEEPNIVDKLMGWLVPDARLRIAADKVDSPTYARDAARAMLGLLDGGPEYGTYHISNAGSPSLYDFASAMRDELGVSATIAPAKDADFPCEGMKSLNGALQSIQLAPLRGWREALHEYLGQRRAQS